ncbi:hypothetical protein BD289DRAFT_98381 [Coniella lustricola]|uniref:Uncharacterized protein n=1 Tax=Coniella lustricola TaxID=2025994 RepID=A0A2T3AN25_9PEZI|nr:hypothetical protein BD289DRAFT_98381 [Coniella lustricola]
MKSIFDNSYTRSGQALSISVNFELEVDTTELPRIDTINTYFDNIFCFSRDDVHPLQYIQAIESVFSTCRRIAQLSPQRRVAAPKVILIPTKPASYTIFKPLVPCLTARNLARLVRGLRIVQNSQRNDSYSGGGGIHCTASPCGLRNCISQIRGKR